MTNLGLALAARGRSVVLADLDIGGSNLATLSGVSEEGPDLGEFFSHTVKSLGEVVRPLWRNLSLIVGAGETLATANPNWGMKQRLLRHLATLDADVVIVDVGAGLHALDFFNSGDIRIVATVPEPTASVDAYRFIKSFLPVVEADADCAASRAFQSIARNLEDELVRLSISPRSTGTSSEEKVELPDLSTPRSPIA